jgi:tRNA-specific 2-thiouridylase
MLARLEPSALERLRFPLAGRTKPQVRALAREAGLSVAEKAESQDLCFLAGVGKRGFLRRRGTGLGARRGEIASATGEVLGHHDGHDNFTVGQRRGLGVAATEPLYVLDKDARTNRVTVGPRSALATSTVSLEDAVLHRDGDRVDAVKLRYRSAPVACRLDDAPARGNHPRLSLTLGDPVDGVAPGQTACLLAGDRVVGCATIRGDERAPSP